MTDAVIVSTARTPIGRARKGSLIGVDAFQLAEVAVGAALERSGVRAADVDDLVLAESFQGGGDDDGVGHGGPAFVFWVDGQLLGGTASPTLPTCPAAATSAMAASASSQSKVWLRCGRIFASATAAAIAR